MQTQSELTVSHFTIQLHSHDSETLTIMANYSDRKLARSDAILAYTNTILAVHGRGTGICELGEIGSMDAIYAEYHSLSLSVCLALGLV